MTKITTQGYTEFQGHFYHKIPHSLEDYRRSKGRRVQFVAAAGLLFAAFSVLGFGSKYVKGFQAQNDPALQQSIGEISKRFNATAVESCYVRREDKLNTDKYKIVDCDGSLDPILKELDGLLAERGCSRSECWRVRHTGKKIEVETPIVLWCDYSF